MKVKPAKKKNFPLSKVYQLIEPGPVVMVTTSRNGGPNVMTMTWLTMVEFEPPLIACVMSDENYSFKNLKMTKECVINIPTIDLAATVVGVGNTTGSKVDKFKKFHLTQDMASQVDVPLIRECYANLECKVVDTRLVKKYCIFVLEVVKAWITTSEKRPLTLHHQGNGVFVSDGEIITLPSKKK